MCAEYVIRKSKAELQRSLGIPVTTDEGRTERPRVRLFSHAPIVLSEGGRLAVEYFQFTLKPPSTKYSTFNARLADFDERARRAVPLYEKPTWKKPFIDRRCLVPMTEFIEPIYAGAHAGQMVEFSDRENETLFAAGLYEKSTDLRTGELYAGFAIIMTFASEFVRKVGHHRQPVFLRPSAFREWLEEDETPEERVQLLGRAQLDLNLTVKTDRAMAKGWEKRASAFKVKADREAKAEAQLDSL